MACADADDQGCALKTALNRLHSDKVASHQALVDSKGLFDTITTMHECRNIRLCQAVECIRNLFDSGETDSLKWIEQEFNISDALTKHNPVMNRFFNRFMADEISSNLHIAPMSFEAISESELRQNTDLSQLGGIFGCHVPHGQCAVHG